MMPNKCRMAGQAVTGGTGLMRTKTVGIRRLWAAYLALCAVMFVVGVYPYLTMNALPHPLLASQVAVDLFVMYGLFGFVVRRPIRSFALRVAFIVAVAILYVRALVVLVLVVPVTFPWRGDAESFTSLILLLGVPLQLLTAFALWRYGTTS
jgi:hypothetical protein